MSGYLDQGTWRPGWYDTRTTAGEFVRPDAGFRGRLELGAIRAQPGRYHLVVSLACPWAHRTIIFRALKALQGALPLVVVDPVMGEHGWVFSEECPSPLAGGTCLHELYTAAQGAYSGRVTVPVLWDSQACTIVNNESAEIIRMLDDDGEYRPPALRGRIDAVNKLVYDNVNNGIYRCGFASTQQAYEKAFDRLFNALDQIEAMLAGSRYLLGGQLTEADWRLFTTLIRFDAVYHGHFKCNRHRIADFHNLSNYVRELYQWPGIGKTVDFEHIKRHYYMSHPHLNPSRIVPQGPVTDFAAPHDRARLAAA